MMSCIKEETTVSLSYPAALKETIPYKRLRGFVYADNGIIPFEFMRIHKSLSVEDRLAFCNYLVANRFDNSINLTEVCAYNSVSIVGEKIINRKSVPTSRKNFSKKKNKIFESNLVGRGHTNTFSLSVEKFKFRTNVMKKKLRIKILQFRSKDYFEDLALPEMDSVAGPPERTVSASNVVLGETQNESKDFADIVRDVSWFHLATTEDNPQYSNLTDRYTLWKTFEWRVDGPDTYINAILPREFITSYSRKDMPMFIPFHMHQYMRGDIEIKIQVNSNKFQAGQLIASWFYGGEFAQQSRDHKAAAVQLPHVLVSAGASNEATLYIPYRYYLAYMHTKQRANYPPYLSMGLFRIQSLVHLTTSDNGPRSCSVAIFIRFPKCQFTGLVDGSVLPEMDLVGEVVEQISKPILTSVSRMLNAPNCDNPPDNTPPNYLVPTAAHSWCIGNGISHPIHRLSLMSSVGMRHTNDTYAESMNYKNIVNKFGLLKTFQWDSSDLTTNVTGSLLWSCNAHPQVDKSLCYDLAWNRGLIEYYFPPCSVVSSLYEYWRGTLEYKFDIIATSFHTGRLLIAYIPGVLAGSKVTLNQARNSAHVVFSLQDSSSFTFVVPFICDRPWWKRKYGGPQRRSEFVSPSALFMFVLNPLVPMESVAKAITIVPYIRAGQDFELAVPVQPAIGLALNTDNIAPSQPKIQFRSGYFPVYVGNWNRFFNSNKCILRYGNVSDHIAQLTVIVKPDDDTRAYVWIPDYSDLQFNYKDSSGQQVIGYMRYGVAFEDEGYNYMIPFYILEDAIRVAWGYRLGLPIVNMEPYIPTYVVDSDFTPGNITWRGEEYPNLEKDNDIVDPEMEREAVPSKMQPTSILQTTANGNLTFGEVFSDLKDLCRRYQLYWYGVVKPPTTAGRDYALLQFPIVPSGLNLDIRDTQPIWNGSREGHIPVIMSGYAYFRGGLRFRIVVSNFTGMIWIQYRPDRPLDHDYVVKIGADIYAADRYRNHSYPFYVQDISINKVIELEIPYYQPGVFGVLPHIKEKYVKSDLHHFTSLGDLVIGVEGSEIPPDIQIGVYYSVADDFAPSVYLGFPSMVACDETAMPEMDFISSCVSTIGGTLVGKAITTPVRENLVHAKKKLVSEIVKEAQERIEPMLRDLQREGSKASADITHAIGDGILKQTLINSIGQFMQVLLNPSPLSFAIAICSLIGSLVVVSVEMVLKLQECLVVFLKEIWYKYFVPANDLHGAGQDALPEIQKDREDRSQEISFFSMIFGLVTTTLGITIRKPKDWPSFTKGMKEDLGLVNNATLFFKNSVEAILYCYEYCIGEQSEVARARRVIEREYPSLKIWVDDALDLLDPRRKKRVFKSAREANRVFDCCNYGSLIIQANLDKSCPGGKIIYELYMKLCKLRDDIVEGGNHPNVRFEPFSVYMVGDQGIGKSFMTAEICKEMLKHVGYVSQEEMIYWIQLGAKYFNRLSNPPVLARDEAYAIGGMFTDEEIQLHMAICSSSVFNPPMAALEDKNKRINPLIYYMNSNVAFPSFVSARCPKAIYRRRKLMVKAQYTPYILSKYPGIVDASSIAAEDKNNFSHLEFLICNNPVDPNSAWSGPYGYNDFIVIAKDKFKSHYLQEQINFRERIRANYCLDPDFEESDAVGFIQELARRNETLKERMERDRSYYQNIIDEADLEAEEPYIQRMWTSAKDLYCKCVYPENDVSIPSCSGLGKTQCGFYSDDRREQITVLIERSGLERGAATKILSGTDIDILEEDDLVGFSLFDDIKEVMNNPDKKYTHWVGTHHTAIFKNFGSQAWGCSEIAHGDKVFLGRWNKAYLGKPSDVTGTEAIRRYVFWLMRQAQFMDIASTYDWSHHLHEMREIYQKVVFDNELNILNWDELSQDPSMLDFDMESIRAMYRRSILLNYLKKSGMGRKVCEHCRVWTENIHNTKNLDYNIRLGKILYEDALGLKFTVDAKCNCDNHFSKLMQNKLFKRAMKIIWNYDHGCVEDDISNPFRMCEYDELHEQSKTFVEKLKNWFTDWWQYYAKPLVNSIIRFIRDHIFTIITALIGIMCLYSSFKEPDMRTKFLKGYAGSYFCSSSFQNAYFESSTNYYSDGGVPRRGPVKSQPAAREFRELDVNVENKILDNTCFLKCVFDSDGKKREIKGRCLGIRNRQVLIIRHYIEEFEKYKDCAIFQLFLFKNGKECVIDLDWNDFKNVRYLSVAGREYSSNFGLMELPKYVPMFRNICSLFPSGAMHKNVRAEADFISAKGPTRRALRIDQQEYLRIAGIDDIHELELDIVYKYAHHGAGLCGSILLSPTVNNGNPGILGMHVAGKNGIGYAEPLCREWFEEVSCKTQPEYVLPNLLPLSDAIVELDGNMLFYGCVQDKYAHRESGKSRIVPSLIHGQVYDVVTEINPLKPNDPRQPPGSHPLRDGCNKHGSGYPAKFNEEILELVNIDSREILINECKPIVVPLQEFSLQDSVCGNNKIPFCDALKWTSSEGFPLSSYRPKSASNKKWLFDLVETSEGLKLEGLAPPLESLLRVREEAREKDKVLPSLYVDCLKDYRLPPEKCKIPGKTRIFSIAPVQTTIDVRRYMGNFLCSYKNACIRGEHGIGINADSLQWTDLANTLLSKGNNIVTGDYSNFGPSLSSQLVYAVIEDILYWHKHYGASDKHIKHLSHILNYEVLTPFHLCGNVVYQPLNGIGSGSPITAELNSEVNKKYIKYAWIKIMRQEIPQFQDLEIFHKKVKLVTYGDDFIMSVADDIKEIFNCVTIGQTLSEYGVRLTSADKGDQIVKYGSLKTSSFLKRSFMEHPYRPGIWLAPISEASITECLNWCHKSEDIRAATEEVIRASLDLAFGKGEEYFTQHRDKINKILILHDIKIKLKEWKTIDKEFFG